MKFLTKKSHSILALAALGMAATTLLASSGLHGTDILHLFSRKAMTNLGLEVKAMGSVDLRQNRQGSVDHQTLDIRVRGLGTNATYWLGALIDGGDSYTQVAEFTTDHHGRATLHYRKLVAGQTLGHDKLPLPAVLDPVSSVDGLAIYNTSSQSVLHADLTTPDRLTYLIKRDLSTTNVGATLRLKSDAHKGEFRLLADGLAANTDYYLVLNGTIVETNAASAKGRLDIRNRYQANNLLGLGSVQLRDTASHVVVSTSLPQ
jgi:hypothetical protein